MVADKNITLSKLKGPIAIISADKEIIELAQEKGVYNVIGVFDRNSKADSHGLPILGNDEEWEKIKLNYPSIKVVLAIDLPKNKERLAVYYGFDSLITLISEDAYISHSATVGHGCIVQRGSKIMADVKVGKCCKININVTVHHDTIVGDFCTLAPGCQLLGSVTIGNGVFVGAGAIVLPKVRVSEDVVIGAGAVLVSDIPRGCIVAGVPAREINRNDTKGKWL